MRRDEHAVAGGHASDWTNHIREEAPKPTGQPAAEHNPIPAAPLRWIDRALHEITPGVRKG